MTRTLSMLVILTSLAAAQQPVETGIYRTGAWHLPGDQASLDLYAKAGFTLVQYNKSYCDWAVEHGLKFIGGVSRWGMPNGIMQPFEANDGTQSMSVGLFTSINFNSPKVETWWTQHIPESVRDMPHADQIEYWKVHNEFGYHAGKYWDYSPGSIARYRTWLQGRYPNIADLNRQWGTKFASFETVEPPREDLAEQLPNWLEWRRFTCWNFADYFKTTGDLIRQVVPDAKVSDNFYTTSPLQGWDIFELARQTSYVAYDIYAIGRWDSLISILDHARCAGAAWDKPFLMMEYHAGPNNWIHEVHADDLFIEANLAWARECRALQWYMWRPATGGREQGIHGITDSQGQPTERLTAVRDVSEKAQRLAPLLLGDRLQPEVALLVGADSAYLAAAQKQSQWAWMNAQNNLGRLLDDARIPHERVDPVWLAAHDPSRYKAIIVASVPVLSDEAMAKLQRFAQQGGTVIYHPGTAEYDGLGHPRPAPLFDAEAVPDAPWTAFKHHGGGLLDLTPVGRGKVIYCGWDPSVKLEAREEQSALYAGLLAREAGVKPALNVSATTETPIDAAVLRRGEASLVILTALSHEPVDEVAVTLPDAENLGEAVYALTPRTSAVQRLPLARQADDATFTLPELSPGAVVIGGTWQPLVGIDSPQRVAAGGTYRIAVTVDNLAATAVSGSVSLNLPAGWVATPKAETKVPSLAPGARASVAYMLTVPQNAAVDRFGIEYPLTAKVDFNAGRTGTLQATALPLLVPALDLELVYHEVQLNPFQELAPAIMRWGWDREVHIPPPPPLAINADVPCMLKLTAEATMAGKQVTLKLEGPGKGTITPDRVTLKQGSQELKLTMRVPQAGEWQLLAEAGGPIATAPFTAGVNTETVETQLAAAKPVVPAGWQVLDQLAVGAGEAPARGTPVTVETVKGAGLTDQARVFDAAGQAVPAAVGETSVSLAADVLQDGVSCYTLAGPGSGQPVTTPAGMKLEPSDGNELVVTSPAYQVAFDTALGLVRWLQVGQGPKLMPHRTGAVMTTTDGQEWCPDGGHGASSLAITSSPVAVEVSFTRGLGPDGQLSVDEKWTLEARHIAVEVRVHNVSKGTVDLSSTTYELGLEPTVAQGWRRVTRGLVTNGELPNGFGAGASDTVDWFDAKGRGIALTLGRCALATKGANGYRGVQHNPARTTITMLGGTRLDPGDFILAEFELWPHTKALDLADAATPRLVTVAR